MTARKGWIFDDSPPPSEWHDSHYSRMADRIAEQERDRRTVDSGESERWRI